MLLLFNVKIIFKKVIFSVGPLYVSPSGIQYVLMINALILMGSLKRK